MLDAGQQVVVVSLKLMPSGRVQGELLGAAAVDALCEVAKATAPSVSFRSSRSGSRQVGVIPVQGDAQGVVDRLKSVAEQITSLGIGASVRISRPFLPRNRVSSAVTVCTQG